MLQSAREKARHDVDGGNDDPRDRVALCESHRAVHRAVEFGLSGYFLTPPPGFVFVNQSGVQIRIDAHLLAGQRVKCEARRDFGDANGAMVDDDILDSHEQNEDHHADDEVSAHDEIAERLDHVAGGLSSLMTAGQNQPRARYIQRQTQQSKQQQQRGIDTELDRPSDIHRRDHRDDGQRDVERNMQIQRGRRDRQHHHQDDNHDRQWQGRVQACRCRRGDDLFVRHEKIWLRPVKPDQRSEGLST